MPIYDYECDKCGYRFELKQGFGAEAEALCPRCEDRARRKLHSVAVIYKGSGFYTTDYKKNGYSPAGEEKELGKPKVSEEKPAAKVNSKTTKEKD